MKVLFRRHTLIFLLLIGSLYSCTKSGSNEEPEQLPEKPIGILPANAETCADFKTVAGASDKATILFSWSAAKYASSYLVEVFESATKVSSTSVTTTTTELTLDKGKLYSWLITAINDDGQNQSSTFSFTTPGEAVGNFAPYAAEISMNFNPSLGELVISWVGKDEDGDTLVYDIVVMEDDATIADDKDLTVLELNPIMTKAGATYTVQIKSKDSFGNFSISINTLKTSD